MDQADKLQQYAKALTAFSCGFRIEVLTEGEWTLWAGIYPPPFTDAHANYRVDTPKAANNHGSKLNQYVEAINGMCKGNNTLVFNKDSWVKWPYTTPPQYKDYDGFITYVPSTRS
jgi:hypothetical protein